MVIINKGNYLKLYLLSTITFVIYSNIFKRIATVGIYGRH